MCDLQLPIPIDEFDFGGTREVLAEVVIPASSDPQMW